MLRQRGTSSSETPDAGSLRLLRRSPKLSTLFIAVPGVGTKPPNEWTDATGDLWLAMIDEKIAPEVGLFAYDYGLSRSSSTMWQDLLDHGYKLLTELVNLVETQKLSHCPVLIVAHSLGGIIVKEAIRLACERTERHIKAVRHMLAGAILMGTPHSISTGNRKWQKVAVLPYLAGPRYKNQSLSNSDIKILTDSCLNFDKAVSDCPILTVSEMKETKIKSRFTRKKMMLVDKDFARVGCNDEETIEVDCDHDLPCHISPRGKLLEFIDTVLGEARLRIAQGSPTYEATITTATAGTSEWGYELVAMPSGVKVERDVPDLPCYSYTVASSRDFCGREDILEKINSYFFPSEEPKHEELESAKLGAKSFAICGPGGMGKTQIATEYVHRCRTQSSFDAIFWISADDPSKIADGIARIAISLGLVPEDSSDAQDQVITSSQARGWLSDPVKKAGLDDEREYIPATWLMVFDNADDLSAFNGILPIHGPGCVLVTSRDPLAKHSRELAAHGVDLGPLSVDVSSQLIKRLTKMAGDSSTVANRLGGLPLAITQMAGVMVRNHLTFPEFVEAWDEKETHEDFITDDHRAHDDGYKKNLSSVWAIENLRNGKALLEVISFLDPDGIAEKILKDHISPPPEGFPSDSAHYRRARTELLQTSLVSRDRTEQQLVVHRLVQDAARAKMGLERRLEVYTYAVKLISAAWPFEELVDWRHGVSRWRDCELLIPHVLCLRKFGANPNNFGSNFRRSQATLDLDIAYCKLMNDAGWYYHETGHFTESLPFIEAAQEVAESVRSLLSSYSLTEPNLQKATQLDTIIAETHHNLGCIGSETNRPEFTLKHFKRFNDLMLQEIDEARQKTDKRLAISWNELGNAYMLNKMWEQGEQCFKQCLIVARRMTNFRPEEFSFPYVNLGLAYWLTSRLEKAKRTMLEGLRFREAAFGRDDTKAFITGRFLYGLGNVAASQGRLDESLGYHQRALRQFRATIGKNHHRTGDVHVRVAEHYAGAGRLKEAVEHLDEALRIFERPIFKPEKARAQFRKSKILEMKGELHDARKLRDESIQSYREICGQAAAGTQTLSSADFDDIVAFWSR